MTLRAFRLLAPCAQLSLVMAEGTYLAHSWGAQEWVMNLYYLPNRKRGFFTEGGFNESRERLVVLRSFRNSEALADCTHGIRLPEEEELDGASHWRRA